MKVSLWAEIRRLHEVERLSQAAIAGRLHCHHRTVRKALAMASPPAPTREPHESVLDAYHAQIDALVATAMIDRLMHHGEAIIIRGDSYRMKDKPTE